MERTVGFELLCALDPEARAGIESTVDDIIEDLFAPSPESIEATAVAFEDRARTTDERQVAAVGLLIAAALRLRISTRLLN